MPPAPGATPAKVRRAATGSGPPADQGPNAELDSLRQRIRELEDEVEAIGASVASQELYLLDGYLIAVRPGADRALIARCPTLRALAQGDSLADVVPDLRAAMRASIEGRVQSGASIPDKDTEARCLD